MFLGYSDPYVEVFINKERKFTTSIKKKTLNPLWDEWVTLQLPKANEQLEIVRILLWLSYSMIFVMIQRSLYSR